MRDKRYSTGVQRIGKKSAGKRFALYCLWNIENPPSHCEISKYVANKEIRDGPTEPCGIIKREIHQFTSCKLQADWCSYGRDGNLNH